jgi:hypothetical protein
MSQIAVPATRPYVGKHRYPEPVNPPPQTLAELEGTTRDLQTVALHDDVAAIVRASFDDDFTHVPAVAP